MPKVSVVIITYNNGKYIRSAVDSILSQSYKDFELLVLDDGSTDDTEEVMAGIDDSRLIYKKSTINLGIPAARNLGIDLSQGKYIAILDADDIAPPYRLQEQFDFMEAHPEIGVLSGDFFSFGVRNSYHKAVQGNERIQYGFLFRCPIANSAAFLRKSVISDNHIRYDTNYAVCTDYKFWISLLNRTGFANLGDKPYLFYRTGHGESISTQTLQNKKLQNRDVIVNKMRREFFDVFRLEITDQDYELFCRFFSYQKMTSSLAQYKQLQDIFGGLRVAGEKVKMNMPIWNALLDRWEKYAARFVDETGRLGI